MSYLNEYKELMVQLLEREKKLQDLMIKTEILKQKIENEKIKTNTEVKCSKLILNEIDDKNLKQNFFKLTESVNELNNLNDLNEIINEQYSQEIYDKLSDESLHELYINSNSTIKKEKKVAFYIEELFNSKNISNEEFELNKIKTIEKITNMMDDRTRN